MFMASSSSPSPATPQVMKHDVFLSFSGKNTRNNFTSHLYQALCDKKIDTFIDYKIPSGDEISSFLLNAIKESKISVIIFSKDYAASRWCLQELEQILDCRRKNGQKVIPVFFYVDPSHVRKQEDEFGAAFAKIQERFKDDDDQLQRWKAALKEAADLSGYPIDGTKTENEFKQIIVDDISNKLRNMSSINDEDPVGAQLSINECTVYDEDLDGPQSSIKKVISLLESVHIVGIWGMRGIGKTTIAHAVFNQISSQFKDHFFIENSRKELGKSGQLTDSHDKLVSAREKGHLYREKVLIVFDDVTYFTQIKNLIKIDCLNLGSRIIITTKDKHIFKIFEVAYPKCSLKVYEVQGLNNDAALRLFCKNAFGENRPPKSYEDLSDKVLAYAQGFPLALEVLGQFLAGKKEKKWKSLISKLEKIPHKRIQVVLEVIYEDLDDEEEKDIFCDMACFFKEGSTSFLSSIFKAFGFAVEIGLDRLIEKCLITRVDDTIKMHNLIQQMGRKLVRDESKNPRKRSRLWDHEDIYTVFEQKKKGEKIQGLGLNMSGMKEIELDPRAFSKMDSLRFFGVYDSGFGFFKRTVDPPSGAFEVENKLLGFEKLKSFSTKVFFWQNCKLKSLPSNFQVAGLVILVMHCSRLERLWNGVQVPKNLKHIDLTWSIYLKEIPDLFSAENLEELILRDCKGLEYLPDNIPSKSIILSGCSELKEAPKVSCKVEELDLSGTAIKKSPFIEDESRLVRLDLSNCLSLKRLSNTICKCKFLEYLSVDGCLKLKRLPEDLEKLKALKTLVARGTSMREVLSSILELSELSSLSLSRCRNGGRLNQFPNTLSGLRSLQSLGLANCKLAELPDDIGQLSSLRALNLWGNKFKSIPASIKDLSNLCYLSIRDCKRLVSLPELPRGVVVNAFNCLSLASISELPSPGSVVNAFNCLSLTSISELPSLGSPTSRPQRLNLAKCSKLNLSKNLDKESGRKFFNSVCYPGNQIPEWFDFKERGTRMHLEFGEDCIKENVLGFTMCVVVEVGKRCSEPTILCSYDICQENGIYKCTLQGKSHSCWFVMADNGTSESSDYVLMDFVPVSNEHEKKCHENSIIDVKYEVLGFYYNRRDSPKIKQCGIHFVYGSDSQCGNAHAIGDFLMAEEQSVGHGNADLEEDDSYSKYLMFGLNPNKQEESPAKRDKEEAEISDSSGKSRYSKRRRLNSN